MKFNREEPTQGRQDEENSISTALDATLISSRLPQVIIYIAYIRGRPKPIYAHPELL